MDVELRNLCVNDVAFLLFLLFKSDSIADPMCDGKMADDHCKHCKLNTAIRRKLCFIALELIYHVMLFIKFEAI